MNSIWTWLAHWLGLDNGSSPQYLFLSGVGSDIGELTILAAVLGAWRHVNCHARHCWRFGKHPVAGTAYKTCRRHHPDLPSRAPTAEHIARHGRPAPAADPSPAPLVAAERLRDARGRYRRS